MHESRFYKKLENRKVYCYLCPRECIISEGRRGFCYIRKNEHGTLIQTAYSHPSSVHIDPIEKKPLFHFFPGSKILSIGTIGCNLGCRFCQNWDISKARDEEKLNQHLTPKEAVEEAESHGCRSIAFTYNEPTIFAEYGIDTANLARKKGIKAVFVTSGYINPEPRKEVYHCLDAANVDLKSFREDFYRNTTMSSLKPVLDTLIYLKKHTDIWFEITNLKIPGRNDSEKETKEMCEWIIHNLGSDVPLHFTAFHPNYKMTDVPAAKTEALKKARDIALSSGIKYVYTGNVVDMEGQTTYCPSCKKELITRNWHCATENRIKRGSCECGQKIPGIWEDT